jgi:hypothetical protein
MGGSLRQLLRGEFWLKPRAKSNREKKKLPWFDAKVVC